MSISVPMMKTQKKAKETAPVVGNPVNAYDIILGKV